MEGSVTVSARLDDRFGRAPLSVVVAPAGFGKTTLLRSWWDRLGDHPKAMISFDSFYRANALDAGRAKIGALAAIGVPRSTSEPLIELLPPDGLSFGSEFVQAVVEVLTAVEDDFVLFFDDVHGLVPGAASDLGRIVSLVADDRHRVVVASRTEPPWPVHRWQVAGFADLVGADDLRMTEEEIGEFLGPEAAPLVPRIAAATGGWPAAVEAVRWHLEVDPTAQVEDALLDLVDYVTAEILTMLDPVEVQVLTRTAILEPFPIGVGTAVTGQPDTLRVVSRAVQMTSLVTRTEDERYCYHAVLREALRRRLTELEPGIDKELHERAADAWLDEPDSFVGLSNAVDHLIEARDWERAVALLRRRWLEVDLQGRLDLYVQWLEAIPGSVWRDDAELLLLYSWSNLRTGRSAPALVAIQDPTIARNPRAAAVARLAYASTIAWSADPVRSLEFCEQARPTLSALDRDLALQSLPSYPGVARFGLAAEIAIAQACGMTGRYDDAARAFEEALRHRVDIAPTVQTSLCGEHGFVLAMTGRIDAATGRVEEALRIAAEAGMAEGMRTAPALIGSAVVAMLTGDRALALSRLAEAARLCRAVRAANLLRICDLVAAICGVEESHLEGVEPALTPSPMPLVDQFVLAAAARRRARMGDLEGATTALQATTPDELTLSAWVEVLLTTGERRAAARWLRSQPDPTCPHGEVIRFLAQAATAEQGAQVAAGAQLAAQAADREQLIGVLLDAPIQLWSRRDVANSAHPLLLEAIQRLDDEDADETSTTALTPREIDLLRLLPLPLSIDELAERLFLSASTVKWHRANLYRKLGVRTRQAAIATAAERGLLLPRATGPRER